jgi:hypothetical protein
MKFWSTTETTEHVSQLMHTNTDRIGAVIALERAINLYLGEVDTGEWKKWRVIYMILNDQIKASGFRETRRLTRKEMTLDFRVFVDYEASINADFSTCVDLLVPALERTLPYFSKAKISEDVQETIRQIIYLAAQEAKAQKQTMH